MLTLGKLNVSKYAMIATRDQDLISNHYQALVNEDLAEMATAIEDIIFSNGGSKRSFATSFGFDTMKTSVLEITNVIQKYARAFEI